MWIVEYKCELRIAVYYYWILNSQFLNVFNVRVNDDVCMCIYIYTYYLFYFAQINTTKTQLGLEISFQTKLCECLSDVMGLTNFLRPKETVDWSKLLKFGRACSNWPDKIGTNTRIGESTIFKVFCKARTMEK